MAVILTGSEYIDLDAHAAAFDFGQPVSFAIAFETVSGGVEFLFAHDRGGDAEVGFYHNDGTLNVRYSTPGGSLVDMSLGGGWNDGNLHRVLAVWTGGTLQGWVDGVLVDSNNSGDMSAATAGNMNIGGADGGLLFMGELSECAVWSTALSSGDAADLTDGTSAVDEVTGTLEGWWPLASDADDASGNDRDGTPINDPDFTESGGTPVGLATETDTAQPIGAAKAKEIGRPSETNTAQPVTAAKTHTLGLNTETEIAQPITALKTYSIGQATESDTAFGVTAADATLVGRAAETDQALPITALKTYTLGLAVETDTALALVTGEAPTPIVLPPYREPAVPDYMEAAVPAYREPSVPAYQESAT